MHEYKQLLTTIQTNGTQRGDRTGNGTLGIFGYMARFSLFDGAVPVLTTKKLHLRGIIHELLWFIQGNTSSNSLMVNGVKIWKKWALDEQNLARSYEERLKLVESSRWAYSQLRKYLDNNASDTKTSEEAKIRAWLDRTNMYAQRSANSLGDLGFVYGGPWRRLPTVDNDIIQVERRTGPAPGPMEPPAHARDLSQYKNPYTGDLPTRWDNGGNPYDLIADVGVNNTIAIRFVKTGAIKVVSRNTIVRDGDITDSYAPKICGVACMGVVHGALGTALFHMWMHILGRCYDPEHALYQSYGARGAYVSPRWLCYENFFNDVKTLPNYERWAKDSSSFDLTKDYYGSMCYDVSTCVFAPTSMRFMFGERAKVYRTITMKGIEKIYIGIKSMSKAFGVLSSDMTLFLEGKETPKRLRGCVIEEIKPDEGKLFRPRLFIDQLADLITGLKNKPFSRRHIVTAWIPEVLPDETKSVFENVVEGRQCLSACHCMFQFYVRPLNTDDRLLWYLENSPDVARVTNGDTEVLTFPRGHAEISNGEYKVSIDGVGGQDNGSDLASFLSDENVPTNALSCMLIQRSSDVPIGVPYNWASYAILTRMVAQVVGMAADEFVWVSGDTHIYNSQIEHGGLATQMEREPLAMPKLKLNPAVKDIDSFTIDDIKLVNYKSHAAINFPVEV